MKKLFYRKKIFLLLILFLTCAIFFGRTIFLPITKMSKSQKVLVKCTAQWCNPAYASENTILPSSILFNRGTYVGGTKKGPLITFITPTSSPNSNTPNINAPTPTPTTANNASSSQGSTIPILTAPVNISSLLAGLKGMNYYPYNNAWDYMWTNWNEVSFKSDMTTIASLHANSVRIIVRTTTFGYPTPTTTMQTELSQAITDAYNAGLKVDLTLFDGWGSYTDISGSEQWATAILSPYRNDARIAYIDLQNELKTSNASAVAWAQIMIPYVRSITGYIPITVSCNSNTILSQQVTDGFPIDLYELHYYGSPGLAYTTFQQAQSTINNKPLYIGETGYSSYTNNTFFKGVDQNQTSQEAQQDLYLRTIAYATNALGLPLPRPWIFQDFTSSAVPPSVFTFSGNPTQFYYGLYRTDGSIKPAGTTMSSLFNGGSIDTSFNNGFEAVDTSNLPNDWRLWQSSSDGYTATFASDCTTAHSSNCSGEISNSVSDSKGTPGFYLQPVKYVVPGQSYTATVYAKGLNATGTNNIVLAWFDSNFNFIQNSSSSSLSTGTTNWTQLSLTATAPTNAGYVELHLASGNNTGSVWFDDVTFN